MSGGTIRTNKNKDFVTISRHVFEDNRLSWEARGVMGYLLGKPDNWTVRMGDLRKQGNVGRDQMQRIMGELEQAGYIRRRRYNNTGTGQFTWITDIYESPELASQSDTQPEAPVPEPLPENPSMATPLPGNPSTGKPSTVNPAIYQVLNVVNTDTNKPACLPDTNEVLEQAPSQQAGRQADNILPFPAQSLPPSERDSPALVSGSDPNSEPAPAHTPAIQALRFGFKKLGASGEKPLELARRFLAAGITGQQALDLFCQLITQKRIEGARKPVGAAIATALDPDEDLHEIACWLAEEAEQRRQQDEQAQQDAQNGRASDGYYYRTNPDTGLTERWNSTNGGFWEAWQAA